MIKILLTATLSLFLASSCLAASSIEITSAKSSSVLGFATEFYTTLNNGFVTLKSEPQNAVLAAKRKDEAGNEFVKQVRISVKQMEENVKLSVESVNVKKDATGKPIIEKLSEPGAERVLLSTLKSVFNDHYSFGYVLSNEYKDGGFVIDAVELGSAAREAGIQPGDILTHVDKKAISQADEGLFNDKALASCFTGKETEFTVLRQGSIKVFKIVPNFEPAMLR